MVVKCKKKNERIKKEQSVVKLLYQCLERYWIENLYIVNPSPNEVVSCELNYTLLL